MRDSICFLFGSSLKWWYGDHSIIGEKREEEGESDMSLSTWSIGKRIGFWKTLFALTMITMALFPLRVWAEDVSCGTGIIVGNQTMLDLWIKGGDGRCHIWGKHGMLKVRPGVTVMVYRDMTCQTEYCSMSITFDDLMSIDLDKNCRVRMLPDCNLSDM